MKLKGFHTEHPHIVCNSEICGGSPIIEGTRISVMQIALMWKGGDSPDEIASAYPHLKLTQIYDAISYYLDHQQEMEEQIRKNSIEAIMNRHSWTIDERGFLHPNTNA